MIPVLNGLSVLIQTGYAPAPILTYLEEGNVDVNGLPMWLFGLAVAVFVCGIGVVHVSTRAENLSLVRSQSIDRASDAPV